MEIEIKTSDNLLEAVKEKIGVSKRTKYKNIFSKEEYNTIIFLYDSSLKQKDFSSFPTQEVTLKKEKIDIKQETIITKLNEEGKIKAYSFLPTGLGHYEAKQELFSQIIRQASSKEKKYIYVKADNLTEKEIKTLIGELTSTLLIILGQEFFYICERKISNITWKIRSPIPNEYYKFTHMAKEFEKIYTQSRKDIFDGRVPYGVGEFKKLCNPHQLRTLLIFEEDEEILGFIETEIKNIEQSERLTASRVMIIKKLFVKEEARRRKIATRLYEKIEEKAKKEKCDRIEVEVYNFTLEAQHFFSSLNLKILSYQYELRLSK